jgi:hypothetical protein
MGLVGKNWCFAFPTKVLSPWEGWGEYVGHSTADVYSSRGYVWYAGWGRAAASEASCSTDPSWSNLVNRVYSRKWLLCFGMVLTLTRVQSELCRPPFMLQHKLYSPRLYHQNNPLSVFICYRLCLCSTGWVWYESSFVQNFQIYTVVWNLFNNWPSLM